MFPSLVLRRRNSGPFKAIFPKKILNRFENDSSTGADERFVRVALDNVACGGVDAGGRSYGASPPAPYSWAGASEAQRPRPNLFTQYNVRSGQRGCFFYSLNSSSITGGVLRASNMKLVDTPPDYPMRKSETDGFDFVGVVGHQVL